MVLEELQVALAMVCEIDQSVAARCEIDPSQRCWQKFFRYRCEEIDHGQFSCWEAKKCHMGVGGKFGVVDLEKVGRGQSAAVEFPC
jgi:hypothetical protein